ncbi:MAG TPA: lysophospholipid acyltransferase family protein [Gemmatimonadaceae bacterium]|nr:lysophospholipid acyltransferase family protein [Gemmatimonadaceae bacterium]
MIRTLAVIVVLLVITPVLATTVLVARVLGVRDRQGSIYDRVPRIWARAILAAAGVRVVVHGAHRLAVTGPRIYVANHVSWFDVFTLAAVLPHYKFVGKAELFRIPLFGAAARAAGMIPIERENRMAAFQSYDTAVQRIRAGASVVVYPEGTRGRSYALRPFKKGPFVLATAAQVPVVPIVLHGTLEIMRKGSCRIGSGRVDVHVLEEIQTAGLGYEDRDRLARTCWERMAALLLHEYGVSSPSPYERTKTTIEST